ncbi:MAG: hypothetical protein RLO50_23540 [Azospirillaceae bacterium]
MRALIIALLQVIAYLGILAGIAVGALVGRALALTPDFDGLLGDPLIGLVAGSVLGLAAGVAVFGPVILLADIRDQGRNTAEALDRLARRQRPETGYRGRREPPLGPEPPMMGPRPPEPPPPPEPPRARPSLRP